VEEMIVACRRSIKLGVSSLTGEDKALCSAQTDRATRYVSQNHVNGLIYRTEPTTKNCKTEKNTSRYVRSNSKSLGNHVASSEEEK